MGHENWMNNEDIQHSTTLSCHNISRLGSAYKLLSIRNKVSSHMITSWSACHYTASSESHKSTDFILNPQLLLIDTPSLGFSYFGTLLR